MSLMEQDRAQRFASSHQVEGAVGLGDGQDVADQLGDLDLAVHEEVDVAAELRASLHATEVTALQGTAITHHDRPHADFAAFRLDAEQHTRPPAQAADLERLAHGLELTRALEADI